MELVVPKRPASTKHRHRISSAPSPIGKIKQVGSTVASCSLPVETRELGPTAPVIRMPSCVNGADPQSAGAIAIPAPVGRSAPISGRACDCISMSDLNLDPQPSTLVSVGGGGGFPCGRGQ